MKESFDRYVRMISRLLMGANSVDSASGRTRSAHVDQTLRSDESDKYSHASKCIWHLDKEA